MPVTIDGVRKLLRVETTPNDKGLTATFEVTAWDNGLVTLNGVPMGGQRVRKERDLGLGLLASVESVAAQNSEFYRLVQERRMQLRQP